MSTIKRSKTPLYVNRRYHSFLRRIRDRLICETVQVRSPPIELRTLPSRRAARSPQRGLGLHPKLADRD